MKQRTEQTFGWHWQDGRMAPSTAETRLFLREAVARAFALEEEEVEDWQIEEELPLSKLPPPLVPALVLAGGRTVPLEPQFEPHEIAWFSTKPA